MTISEQVDPTSAHTHYRATLSAMDIHQYRDHVAVRMVELIAQQLAAQFLADHGPSILSKINPEAVASMAIAEAGAALNETLHKKMPDKILEIEREGETVILQRGIFGGVKRL